MDNFDVTNLVGKKIIKASITGLNKDEDDEYDDLPILKLDFDDGTKVSIIAYYGEYTGKSSGEYPRYIEIYKTE